MGITKGKGLAGALGSARDMNYGYVPLPYKEMMTGNLMRQASYDKGQATLDEVDALYDETFIDKDSAILDAQEKEVNDSVNAMIESAGGDLGKLTGEFTNLYRKTASNKTYRNAKLQKANRTAFSEELRKAKLDQGMAQYYLDKADDAYVGADKGQYNGVSYSNIKQNDIYKNLVSAGSKVSAQTTSREEPGFMYQGEFYPKEYLEEQGIDGIAQGLTETTRTIKTSLRDPIAVQNKLNDVLGANPSWVQSMSDYSEANGLEFQDYALNLTTQVGALFEKGDSAVGKGTSIPKGTEVKTPYKPLELSGPAINIPTEQFTVGRDENGNKMDGMDVTGKLAQLHNPKANIPLDLYSSEQSLWALALDELRESKPGKEITYKGYTLPTEYTPNAPGTSYDIVHGEGAYAKLKDGSAEKAEADAFDVMLDKMGRDSFDTPEGTANRKQASRASFERDIREAMDVVLKDATIALNYDLLDENLTKGGVNHVIASLNTAANRNFEGLGIQLTTVNNKGDEEGSREPTGAELQGNLTEVNISEFSKRPIYDSQKGITGYRVRGNFVGIDENIHSFEAIIPSNNPLLPQIYQNAGLPPLSSTMNSLGKLMVRDQVVTPPKLAYISKSAGASLGVYANPDGGYNLVELDGRSRPKEDAKGNVIAVRSESGKATYTSLNQIAQYIEEEHYKLIELEKKEAAK